jgi:HlyD family secretion protein
MKSYLRIALGVTLAAVSAQAGDSSKSATRFQEQAVTRGPLTAVVRATGTLEPEEVVDIGAQVSGTIQQFGTDPADEKKTVDFGTVVKKGTVLALLDPAPYEAKVVRARAAVQRAQARLRLSRAKVALAEQALRRAKKRQADKTADATDVEVAQAELDVARAAVPVDEADIATSEAALQHAQMNLRYCTIASPVDAVVIDRRCNVGQTVTASLNAPSLFLLAKDLKKLQVWISVPEADIGGVMPGQRLHFSVKPFPKKLWEGRVTQVRLNATMTDKVVTYTVTADVDNSDGKLLPYLTADVAIVVGERKAALLVPNAALRWRPQFAQVAAEDRPAYTRLARDDRSVVWVAEKGLVRMVRVKTGLSDGKQTEIVEGDVTERTKVVTGDLIEYSEPPRVRE